MELVLHHSPWLQATDNWAEGSSVSCAWACLPEPTIPAEWLPNRRVQFTKRTRGPIPLEDRHTYLDTPYHKLISVGHFKDEWIGDDLVTYKDRVLMRGSKNMLNKKYNCSTNYSAEANLAAEVCVRYWRKKITLERPTFIPAIKVSQYEGGPKYWENPIEKAIETTIHEIRRRYWAPDSTWYAYGPSVCRVIEKCYPDYAGDSDNWSNHHRRWLELPNVMIKGKVYRVEGDSKIKALQNIEKHITEG